MGRRRIRIALAGALAAALALGTPLAASAHVRVSPGQVAAGATNVQLTFSVPTEAVDAPNGETTVLLRVQLSATHPFGSVYVQPVPGWTGKAETTTLPKPVTVDGAVVATAVTAVVWTADPGKGIPKGSFQNFVISVSPVPDVGRLEMPATQQFSSGAVENWKQSVPHGKGTAPAHPAPTLYVTETPPTLTGGGMTGMSGMSMGESTSTISTVSDATTGSALPLGLGIVGLVVGAAGFALGLIAFLRTRRREPTG